ncbi:WbqC family protein [Hyunsoonleella ulvae]|uniref:WbqC family protein n=1 Tax=Hyunsoonleella ulvae TaxID=2799948 RepID=UPI00193AA118|nr:WbqC family protein [Hyunsoonleella ulvae]
MAIVMHPTYFPNIAHFVATVQSKHISFEFADSFVKQTYRNRCCIYGANGKLPLTIPAVYSQKKRQLYKDVKIFNEVKWQLQHWKSLESAYRTSPFFEFYEDELKPLFFEEAQFLMDFNLKCFQAICDCLQLEIETSKTKTFEKTLNHKTDFRFLVNAKNEINFGFEHYTQVFTNKHGFMSNLSILDLLFNEGPNALNYLESQTLVV